MALLTGPLLKTSARRIAERTDIPVEKGRFIDENYRAVARLIDTPPHTVMHGDAHPGNVYFRNGAAGLLDWQAVRRGHPSRELAYTLVTSMTTADRQVHERDLLDHLPPCAGRLRAVPSSIATSSGTATGRVRCIAYVARADHRRNGRHAGRRHRAWRVYGAGVAALEDLDTVAVLREVTVTDGSTIITNPND